MRQCVEEWKGPYKMIRELESWEIRVRILEVNDNKLLMLVGR